MSATWPPVLAHRVLPSCVRAIIAWALIIAACAMVCRCAAAADNTFTVTSTLDDGSAGTLRWAISQANSAGAGTQTIVFSVSANSTITLTGSLPILNNSAGLIVINGAGANGVTINGNDAHRAFFVQSGNVAISNLNIDHTLAKGGDGGADPLNGGGGGLGAGAGVFVNQGANVSLQGVTFDHNAAVGGSGGTLTGSGVGGGGGGGGLGGNGGDGGVQGGGGGGGLNTNGGNGGTVAGGGGGGVVGDGSAGGVLTGGAGSPPGGNGGNIDANGASGGTFGGGGGGGTFISNGGDGGAGGDFGGGGGAGQGGPTGGGIGGFGGGGGGATFGNAGTGGFGGGNGGVSAAGNGGSGFGGAVFVRQGGILNILDSSTSNNSVTAGASGGAGGVAGDAAGQDLYLMSGVNAHFGGADNSFTGSISGAGSVTIQSTGTTTFTGVNSYLGGTTVSSGTLAGNADSLQGGILNNANVNFDQSFNGTYAGAMSGSGSLLKSGAGNLILTGANTYSGGTTISGGILIGTSTSVQGDILNNAQLTFDQNFDGTYSGTITGTGSLVKSGTGNLTLVGTSPFALTPIGINTYGGGTTVSGGILTGTTSSLQGAITNNAQVTLDQSFDGNFVGSISGSGSLVKTGASNVMLIGTNSYAGGTTISQGGLIGDTNSLQGNILAQANTALLFQQSFDGTYSGNLSGSGTLYKTFAGSLTMTGTNSFTGQTLYPGRPPCAQRRTRRQRLRVVRGHPRRKCHDQQ
jgi:fibronectin-binding autotransporter adhesin